MVERQTYTVEEYAKVLGKHPQTVVKRMSRGLIPGQKVDGRWEITKAEVDQYLRREWTPKRQEKDAA